MPDSPERMTEFARDVLAGMASSPKHLSSKYFYDDAGSWIFQEIMEMAEYYLTDAESEIFEKQAKEIADAISDADHFKIIELGAGDGSKTFHLLKELIGQRDSFVYTPVDISEEVVRQLRNNLVQQLEGLTIEPVIGDYFQVLGKPALADTRNVLFFLGSNLGNYDADRAEKLLKLFNNYLNPGGKLLIGLDLQKNPNTIRRAYDDEDGITARFNLNLLTRINRELGADFDLDKFDFYCHYNPTNGEVKSYLVSLEAQPVSICDQQFELAENELIWTELSKKYTLQEVDQLAESTGFKVERNYLDSKKYFVDSLWVKQ